MARSGAPAARGASAWSNAGMASIGAATRAQPPSAAAPSCRAAASAPAEAAHRYVPDFPRDLQLGERAHRERAGVRVRLHERQHVRADRCFWTSGAWVSRQYPWKLRQREMRQAFQAINDLGSSGCHRISPITPAVPVRPASELTIRRFRNVRNFGPVPRIATKIAGRGRARYSLNFRVGTGGYIPLLILGEPERLLLAAYVERFNARDFVAIRDMLADEVRLDLVAKLHKKVRMEVATYNYARLEDRNFVPGLVDRRTAVLVRNPSDPDRKSGVFHSAAMGRRQGSRTSGSTQRASTPALCKGVKSCQLMEFVGKAQKGIWIGLEGIGR